MIMFACNMFCYSQTSTSYVGKGKLYQLQAPSDETFIYCANYNSTNETLYGEHITSNNICVFEYPNNQNYSSTHGDYIEIQHSQKAAGTNRYIFSKGMLFMAKGYGLCAFTIKEKTLYLIRVEDDTVLSVLDDNFNEGSDFSIFVEDDNTNGYKYEPDIYILNNGYLKFYVGIPTSLNSINTVRSEEVNDKLYNIGGVEVDNPRSEIYIQGGKKIIKKE